MPGFQLNDEAEAPGRAADLLDRGIDNANPRPVVDQEQLPLQRCRPRRLFGENGTQHRPEAEFAGVVAQQSHLGDAAFDHPDPNPAIDNVLRGNDRPAEVKAGRAIEIADRGGDRCKVGLGYFLSEIRLIGAYQGIARYRHGADNHDGAELELRSGITRGYWPLEPRHPQSGSARLRLPGFQIVETLFGLSRIETRLDRLLRNDRRDAEQHQAKAQHRANGTTMPPGPGGPRSVSVVQRRMPGDPQESC